MKLGVGQEEVTVIVSVGEPDSVMGVHSHQRRTLVEDEAVWVNSNFFLTLPTWGLRWGFCR